MTCDKLHPSGNGINSNIVDCEYEYKNDNLDSSVHVGAINNLEGYNDNDNKPCSDRSDSSIDSSSVYSNDKYIFITNSYGLTSGFLQYPRRELNSDNYYSPNYRGGDTAFFSGLTTSNYPSTYPQYDPQGQDVFPDSLKRFYLNLDNTEDVMSVSNYYGFANHVNYMTHSLQGDTLDSSIYRDRRFNWELDYVVGDCLLPFYFYQTQTTTTIGNKTKTKTYDRNIYELICVNRNTGETYTFRLKSDYDTISESTTSLSFSIYE